MSKESIVRVWMIDNADIDDEVFEEVSSYVSTSPDGAMEYSAALVFEEVFVNIAKYAYESMPMSRSPVAISVAKGSDGVELTFVDFGSPFDPTKHDHTVAVPGKTVGGQGIRLVELYSREVSYTRAGQANVLRVLL